MSNEDYEHRAQERFWAKVDKSGGPDACWPWTASRLKNGYGSFRYRGKAVYAHRFALGAVDPTPGLEACHSCGNSSCCNPKHLRLDTREENMKDMVAHGRSRRGERNPFVKITESEVRKIRRERDETALTHLELAKKYGTTRQNVGLILSRKSWKHVV